MARHSITSDTVAIAASDIQSLEHKAYKTSHYAYQEAAKRLRCGDDDSTAVRLENAREARKWALDEVVQRLLYNNKWYSGLHSGIVQQARQRKAEIDKYDVLIERMEREIARTQDIESSSQSEADEEDNNEDEEEDQRSSGSSADPQEHADDSSEDTFEEGQDEQVSSSSGSDGSSDEGADKDGYEDVDEEEDEDDGDPDEYDNGEDSDDGDDSDE